MKDRINSIRYWALIVMAVVNLFLFFIDGSVGRKDLQLWSAITFLVCVVGLIANYFQSKSKVEIPANHVDRWANAHGLERKRGESDDSLRARIRQSL